MSEQPVGRGILQNPDRKMTDAEATNYLINSKVAHVATVGEDGWPYVLPFVYVYEGGNKLYLHNGNIRESLFFNNISHDSRVCLEVSEMNEIHPGRRHACGSALVYSSVVAYGNLKVVEGDAMKIWFYDRLLAKYGNPEWKFEPGYPAAGKTRIFELELDIVTGKRSEGFKH